MAQQRFGTLVIIVDRARNLPNRKKIGKQDAYAIVRLGHEMQKTPTDKRAGQVPSWNHEIRFMVPSESENILKVSIFSEDSKTPELVGDCAIDLTELYKNHEFDSWFDLKYKDKPAGEVYAELTFYYEGPPKPRPKVELPLEQLERPDNRSSRSLPHVPSRQGSLAMPGISSSASNYDDPALALAGLNLGSSADPARRHYTDLARSPYQTGVRYVETWDGIRDGRIITPAPGDVRRKSMSGDMQANNAVMASDSDRCVSAISYRYNDHVHEDWQDSQYRHGTNPSRSRSRQLQESLSYRGYAPESVSSNGHDRATEQAMREEELATRMHDSRHVDANEHVAENGLWRFDGPAIKNAVRDHYQNDTEFVEPVLDPRYGSQYELRNSPRIVSPHPEYPSTYRRSPVLEQENFDYGLYRSKSQSLSPAHLPEASAYQSQGIMSTRAPPSGYVNETEHHKEQYRRHSHVQSYSQSSSYARDPLREWPQSNHGKSASTSGVGSQRPIASRDPSSIGNLRHSGQSSASNRPRYAHELNYQEPSTFAITPAQHTFQNRPLPRAPDMAPARPAKIPLGLTQEEYDILNGN